ncbi:ANTAR domain-containing response regulator [Alteromonas flava]|uniref:ANTAR domain-containing response regulator n=1 Tax=Alteromonas flava TaxID=2048003 RepID=UPI000C28A65A|nr:ANTAR domain-containing protein [Alteromonas flava]
MSEKSLIKVLLVESNLAKAELVSSMLNKSAYQITHVTSRGLSLLREVEINQPDLIIMDVESPDRDIIESLNQISQLNPKPVVMFSDDEDTATINSMMRSGVSAYVVGNVDPTKVKSIIDIAIARFSEYQRLRKELVATKKKLTSQKSIEQAKIWLMETKGLTEKEAYHRIRKMAMDNSQKIEDVANNILSLASMLDN